MRHDSQTIRAEVISDDDHSITVQYNGQRVRLARRDLDQVGYHADRQVVITMAGDQYQRYFESEKA